MKHRLPPLDSLKAFESAARHLSFSRAAEELCISKGAMSYQIKRLEEQLECRLFNRAVRQVYLTDAGQALLNTTKTMFDALDETVQSLQGEHRQLGVSIATSTYVAARWLSPRISQFNEQYPDIAIRLHHSINSTEFKLADVDLAIRWGECDASINPPNYRTQLNQIPMPLYPTISPKLMQKLNPGQSIPLKADAITSGPLSSVPLLCEERQLDLWNEWIVSALPDQKIKLTTPRRIISDANVRVQAAIDGQGWILADDLMSNEIDNGLLAKPFAEVLHGYGYAIRSSSSRTFTKHALTLKNWFADQTPTAI